MNDVVAKLWVEALRSGRYEQTRGRLRSENLFCCMGVLCDLHAGQFDIKWHNDMYLDERCVPPPEVMAWAEMKSPVGEIPSLKFCLTELNDTECCSFAWIANAIEQNAELL